MRLVIDGLVDEAVSGRVSPRERVEQTLEKARRLQSLNTFISLADGAGLEVSEPRRDDRLLAVPIAVKDNLDVAGLPCTAGTPALRDWRPPADAAVIRRLRQSGAVIVGKTNMHELAAGVTSNNQAFGPVRNPYDPNLIPGGSSGGSAAAVAAGIVPAALGTDTAGSCRVPASLCGCVGFRPTLGRYPSDGLIPLSLTRDTVGTLTRSVQDTITLDQILSTQSDARQRGGTVRLQDLRLGVPRPYFYEPIDAEVAAVIDAALSRLSDAGVTLVETTVTDVERLTRSSSLPLILFESVRDISTYLNRHRATICAWQIVEQIAGPNERRLLQHQLWGDAVPAEAYRHALESVRPAIINAYRRCLTHQRLDALIVPTTPIPARPIGDDDEVTMNAARVSTAATYMRNVDPTAVAGCPSVSVPAGLTATGLPVGLSFDGLPGTDRRLLAIANAFADLSPPLPSPAVDRLRARSSPDHRG